MNPGFLLPTGIRNDVFFDEMPTEVRDFLGFGFSKLASLPKTSLADIASQVSTWLDPVELEPEIDILARQFDIGRHDMTAIISAVSLLTSACFAGPRAMPFQTFVAKATTSGILKDSTATAIQAFGDELLSPHSEALSDALARANASTNIVPSFQHLATTVDLRVVAVYAERVVTAPVVMAMLRTDVEDQELLFQMTPRDVGELLRQLQELSDRLSRSKKATTHFPPRD